MSFVLLGGGHGQMRSVSKERRTQDFTMEGVHVMGPGQQVWGTEVAQ